MCRSRGEVPAPTGRLHRDGSANGSLDGCAHDSVAGGQRGGAVVADAARYLEEVLMTMLVDRIMTGTGYSQRQVFYLRSGDRAPSAARMAKALACAARFARERLAEPGRYAPADGAASPVPAAPVLSRLCTLKAPREVGGNPARDLRRFARRSSTTWRCRVAAADPIHRSPNVNSPRWPDSIGPRVPDSERSSRRAPSTTRMRDVAANRNRGHSRRGGHRGRIP
jgi:hypothetical protein